MTVPTPLPFRVTVKSIEHDDAIPLIRTLPITAYSVMDAANQAMLQAYGEMVSIEGMTHSIVSVEPDVAVPTALAYLLRTPGRS